MFLHADDNVKNKHNISNILIQYIHRGNVKSNSIVNEQGLHATSNCIFHRDIFGLITLDYINLEKKSVWSKFKNLTMFFPRLKPIK